MSVLQTDNSPEQPEQSTFNQIMKFSAVGVVNTLIGLGVIYLCMEVFRFSYILSNIVGYGVGLIISFVLNRNWTFRSQGKWQKESLLFLLVFAVCFPIQLGVVILLKEKWGLTPRWGQLIGVAVYTTLNFLGNKFITFSRRKTSSPKVDFDQYATNYRDIHNQNIGVSGADSNYFSQYKVQEMLRHEISPVSRILDLGCGDGMGAGFIARYFPGAEVFGTDVSAECVLTAKKNTPPHCHFSVYDGLHLPYDSEHFDIVFVSCVFHHVPRENHSTLVGEIHRVLKKGGRVYLFEHNPVNPLTRKIVRDCVFDRDAVLLPARYGRRLFRSGGFSLRLRYTIFFPRTGFFNRLVKLEKFLHWLPLGGQYYIRAVK